MPKSKRKRRAGLAPGSAVYVGQERDFRSEVEIVHYDPDGVQELRGLEALDTEAVRQPTPVTWVKPPPIISTWISTGMAWRICSWGDCRHATPAK